MSNEKSSSGLNKLTEFFGWLQVVFSPTLAGLILGALYYLYSPNTSGIIVGAIIVFLGMLVGIIWATRVKRKYGAIWFVSRTMATPELDEEKEGQ